MIDRKYVKERQQYLLDGKPVWVFMIHKPGSGESVTLSDIEPYSSGFYKPEGGFKADLTYMQMRKFQRRAALKEGN